MLGLFCSAARAQVLEVLTDQPRRGLRWHSQTWHMAFSDSHDSNTRHLPFSTTEDVVSEEGLIELPKSLPGRDHEPHSAYATFPLHR